MTTIGRDSDWPELKHAPRTMLFGRMALIGRVGAEVRAERRGVELPRFLGHAPRPTCPCGRFHVQCSSCSTWWCNAPGHVEHRCSP